MNHKEQKNLEYLDLDIGSKYKVTASMEESPFGELDFIRQDNTRVIHFNVEIISEHPNFFLAKALPDEYIVRGVNVTISKSHLLTKSIKLKKLN